MNDNTGNRSDNEIDKKDLAYKEQYIKQEVFQNIFFNPRTAVTHIGYGETAHEAMYEQQEIKGYPAKYR